MKNPYDSIPLSDLEDCLRLTERGITLRKCCSGMLPISEKQCRKELRILEKAKMQIQESIRRRYV